MSFEDLDVWKGAVKLSGETYRQTFGLKDFGFRDQVTRSALSIPSNIAEGYEGKTIARSLIEAVRKLRSMTRE
jgi:four helix bundle protein